MIDSFTHLERMIAEFEFRRPDRVPVFLNNALQTARCIGAKAGELNRNPDRFAEALVASFRKYDYDGIRINADVAVEAEAMGGVCIYPEDAPAYLKVNPVKDKADFDKLKTPDPHKDGRMPIMLKTTELVRKAVGDDVYIASSAMGPMNLASQLLGISNVLMLPFRDPDFLQRVLDFTTEITIAYGKAYRDAGATCITMGEAMCSMNIISPKIYRKFIQPHHKVVIDAFNSEGIKYHTFHICGQIAPILTDVADTGVASLDIDSPVDIAASREKLGKRMAMLGNISPDRLRFGTPEEITELAKGVLSNKEGLGLALGAGCNMQLDTPEENIWAIMHADELYGLYD